MGKLNNKAYKKIYSLHIAIGLLVSFNFFLLSVSGLILLFKEELSSQHQVSSKDYSSWEKMVPTVLSEVKQKYPELFPLALFQDEKNKNIIKIRLGTEPETRLRDSVKLNYNVETLSFGESAKKEHGFFVWLLELHRELFLGFYGKLYVGFIGLLYVFLLISGFVIYGRFMKNRRFGDIRNVLKFKLADLHKYFGVTSFAWALLVGFTGALLAFNSLIIKYFQASTLNQLASKYENSKSQDINLASLSQLIKQVQDKIVDAKITFISFPSSEFGVEGNFVFLLEKIWLNREQASHVVVGDPQLGAIKEIVEIPFYLKALVLSQPLHFGDFGGLPLKLVWFFFALMSLFVMLMGIGSYYIKNKKKKSSGEVLKSLKGLSVERSVYARPLIFVGLTSVGVVGALFKTGLLFYFSLFVMSLPLLYIVGKARTRV